MATVMHSQKADGKAHMFVPSREDMQRRRLLFEWVQECGRDDSVTYMDLTATYGARLCMDCEESRTNDEKGKAPARRA